MSSNHYSTAQHYTVETEWQATPRVRAHVRRIVDARDNPGEALFDATALTAALRLSAKPHSGGVARLVRGNYAIPYDILIARARRRRRITSVDQREAAPIDTARGAAETAGED